MTAITLIFALYVGPVVFAHALHTLEKKAGMPEAHLGR
jgi:hypothetical protein